MALQGVYGLNTQLAAQLADAKDKQKVPGGDTFAAMLALVSAAPTPQASALTPTAKTEPPKAAGPAAAVEDVEEKSALQEFLDYMSKSPMERWREAWLKQHKLSEDDLAAMPPEKRMAIEEAMAQDLKEQMQRDVEKRLAEASGGAA